MTCKKMALDLTKVDLSQPAFAQQEVPVAKEDTTAEDSQSKSGEQDTPASGGEKKEPVVEEQNVPYSRLRETVEARRAAEKRAAELEEKLDELTRRKEYRNESEPPVNSGDLPSWWVKMYGDNENSRQAWNYWQEGQKTIQDAAKREALEAVRNERNQEAQVNSRNESILDNRLEDLSLNLGRVLSEAEEMAILDIVDDYTPKDNEGNYAGELLSMDKAWEIYQFKQAKEGAVKKEARKPATVLTSTRTDGETTTKSSDKDFNPKDWNAWKKRLPK